MNLHRKIQFILVIGLGLCSLGSLGWGSTSSSISDDAPGELEEELRDLLSAGMAGSNNPEELCRLASLYLDLGYGLYVDEEKKIDTFQEGARLAKKALEQQEASADAHFLYAANLGSVTELQGVMYGALTIQELKHHIRRALDLDPTYAPAHHMLGRMYEELPWFLGGDQERAGQHLKKSIFLDSHYVPGHLDLGRWYLKQGKKAEAVREFMFVVQAPPFEKKWIWERIHRPQAEDLLRELHAIEQEAP